jgi:hypothetical protein
VTIPETFTGAPATTPSAVSLSEVRTRIQRPRRVVHLVLDTEAAAELEELEALLEKVRELDEQSNEPDQAPAVAERLAALHRQAEDSRQRFVLQAVSWRRYQQLRAAHPPTPGQIEERAKSGAQDEPAFNPDTFPGALVREQMLEPAVASDEEFAEFWDDLSDGQMNVLWTAAFTVQMGVTELGPKSASASEVLRSFGLS